MKSSKKHVSSNMHDFKAIKIHMAFGKAVYKQIIKKLPTESKFEEKEDHPFYVKLGKYFLDSGRLDEGCESEALRLAQAEVADELCKMIPLTKDFQDADLWGKEMTDIKIQSGYLVDQSHLSKKQRKKEDAKTQFVSETHDEISETQDVTVYKDDGVVVGVNFSLKAEYINSVVLRLCNLNSELFHRATGLHFHQKDNKAKRKFEVSDELSSIYSDALSFLGQKSVMARASKINKPNKRVRFMYDQLVTLDGIYSKEEQPSLQTALSSTATALKFTSLPQKKKIVGKMVSTALESKEVEPEVADYLFTIFGEKVGASLRAKQFKWFYCSETIKEHGHLLAHYILFSNKDGESGCDDNALKFYEDRLVDKEITMTFHRKMGTAHKTYSDKLLYHMHLTPVEVIKQKAAARKAAKDKESAAPPVDRTLASSSLSASPPLASKISA